MPKIFATWSGGKESALACFEAKQMGLEVSYLVNMITEDRKRSMTHGLAPRLLWLQAQAIGIPIVQKRTVWKSYEEDFKNVVSGLKKDGISGGVFGEVDLKEHRDWDERVSRELEIRPYLPLWEKDQIELLEDFIEAGFKAIVVATKAELLGKEWLGRKVDGDFIRDISNLKELITPCGERGEYHTFVFDGPIFKRPVEFIAGKRILKNERWFLQLSPTR